jgi:glycosyl transferase family 25
LIITNFDRIRVINLRERSDRRMAMVREFQALGASNHPKLAFHEAVRTSTAGPWRSIGEHGCFLSHLAVIREAAEANESVLVLEDDCDFTRAAHGDLPVMDVLWGGYKLHETHIEGAHCIGFSAKAAKRLVPYLTALLDQTSPPPVDGAYILFCRDNPDLRVLACSPMLAVQRPSDSNIATSSRGNKCPLLRNVVKATRPLKRALKRRIHIQGEGQDAFEALINRLKFDASKSADPEKWQGS